MSMPTIFVSHGSPTLILNDVPARAFLASLGQLLPRPKAIVAVSAHWDTDVPAVSLARKPETIHDFYGFPEPLYRLRYAAPGAPELAERVAKLTGAAHDPHRGLDHGAWVPAMLGWPKPTSRSSSSRCSPTESPAHHIALGRKLAPLREEGVLVMGWAAPPTICAPWCAAATASPSRGPRPSTIGWRRLWRKATRRRWPTIARAAPNAREAHPTDEHFLPLHVAYGAAGEGAHGRALHRSFTMGNLSMASYAFA